ncbi:MAG TPA: hypothetical protein VGR00_01360, partial [Thermoanaerobaculia bacterium]|nr:hypothetical protein [Thermoanaerobaculia bacterium]
FTHPVLDGLWRLLVGPNKGILLYFPLVALAVTGLLRLARDRKTRGAATGIAGVFVALLLLASAWWAWDGTIGWGPRLLVPSIPLLAAAAGVAASAGGGARLGAFALVAVGAVVNLLGVLQPEVTANAYMSRGTERISEEEARKYPEYFVYRGPEGPVIARDFRNASDAAFSPVRVHAFLLLARLRATNDDDVHAALASPPWKSAHPEFAPDLAASPGTMRGILVANLTGPFRWPHLFEAVSAGSEERALLFNGSYDDALADQAFRNLDISRPERALPLARRLFELAPSGYAAALQGEALRAAGDSPGLTAFFSELSPRYAASPLIALVRALWARDFGDEAAARGALANAARVFRTPAIERALTSPLSAWPKGLHAFIGENLEKRGGGR